MIGGALAAFRGHYNTRNAFFCLILRDLLAGYVYLRIVKGKVKMTLASTLSGSLVPSVTIRIMGMFFNWFRKVLQIRMPLVRKEAALITTIFGLTFLIIVRPALPFSACISS